MLRHVMPKSDILGGRGGLNISAYLDMSLFVFPDEVKKVFISSITSMASSFIVIVSGTESLS